MNQMLSEKITNYKPSKTLTAELKRVHFVALIGPAGIGKNMIARELVKLDGRYKKVVSHVTRDPRGSEANGVDFHFEPYSEDQLALIEAQVNKQELVQIAQHPTTGHLYWSDIEAWNPGGFSVLDVLPRAVEDLRRVEFGNRTEIMLAAYPDEWQKWFAQRVAELSQHEADARKKEAILNIEWGLEQNNVEWVVNRAGKLRQTARRIIDIVEGNFDNSSQARRVGEQLLRTIRENQSDMVAASGFEPLTSGL